MDARIFRAVMEYNKDTPGVLDLKGLCKNDVSFLQEATIRELSKVLTKYFSCKISKEAYQKYSVRLSLIHNLRECTRMKGTAGYLPVFRDIERTYRILFRLLKKYLTRKTISACDNSEVLVTIGEILLLSLNKDRSLMKKLENVVKRIIDLDKTERSIEFCKSIISSKDICMDSSLLEMIYVYGKEEMIENPITDCFVKYCTSKNDSTLFCELKFLFSHVLWNPRLFTILSFKMKEIFLESEYSELSQDFIQCILKKIEENCECLRKDMVEVYPIRLQSTVVFFRLPEDCKRSSKDYAKNLLKELYLDSNDYAEMIVSQFPKLLPVYLEILKTDEEESSDEQSNHE